jgi:hypothetical protein
LAPGTTTIVLSAFAMVMPECVGADPADQRGRRAQFGRGHRLVRAFAAGKIKHGFAGDGFADPGMPVGCRHNIHVDATGDEHPPHDCPQNA